MTSKSKKLKLNLVLHAPEPLALEAREALEQSLTKLLYQLIANLSLEKGGLRIVLERDPVFDAGGDFAGASMPRPAVIPPLSTAFPRNLKAAGRPAWTPAPPPTTTKAKGGTT